MAVATNVRVEATSLSTTTLRWSDTASLDEQVYRSTDGVTYASVAVATTGADGLGSYGDTGLAPGTKYWYKITNDGGSNFSSAVTVITQSCGVSPAQQTDVALPRVGDEVTADSFNTLADAVETSLVRFTSPQGQTCVACITDGALVIDCVTYADCQSIEVAVDQDINSISLPNCDNSIVDIGFIIPPNTTRKIGGWPKGIGFTGDEGFQAPIVGGVSGRFVNEFINRNQNINGKSGKSKPGTTTQGTAQGGSAQGAPNCTCIPGTNGELTIKTCTPAGANQKTNSMNCGAATPGLVAFACGGRGPYTWTKTGSGITLGKTDGVKTTVTPAANTGSATAGTAYKVANKYTASAGGVCQNWVAWTDYGCNNQVLLESTAADGIGFFPCGSFANLASLSCSQPGCCTGTCTGTPQCAKINCAGCSVAQLTVGGSICDVRTAPMITAGCTPCGTSASGATITVTDALGTQTTIVLSA